MTVVRMLLLAVLVLAGLLGMHTLGGHGSAHGEVFEAGSSASAEEAAVPMHTAHASAAHGGADARFSADAHPACLGCDAVAGGAGAACVLGLLTGILLIVPPVWWRGPGPLLLQPAGAPPASAPDAPPSLSFLCISRT